MYPQEKEQELYQELEPSSCHTFGSNWPESHASIAIQLILEIGVHPQTSVLLLETDNSISPSITHSFRIIITDDQLTDGHSKIYASSP